MLGVGDAGRPYAPEGRLLAINSWGQHPVAPQFAGSIPGQRPPAGFDRRHNFQLGFAYALPWQTKGSYDGVLSAIVND